MKKLYVRFLATGFSLLIAGTLSGCSPWGGRGFYKYDSVMPSFSGHAQGTVAVAVVDRRSYICSLNKTADFVGVQRGGYGIPHEVTTTSKKPFSVELSGVVGESLRRVGVEVKEVLTSPCHGEKEVISLLSTTRAFRYLILSVNEWKTDAMTSTRFDYDVTATVLDQSGTVRGSSVLKGSDRVEGSFFRVGRTAELNVLNAAQEKLEALLNDPKVTGALAR